MAPIRPNAAPAADREVDRAPLSGGGRRLATIIDDFLLNPDNRLSEQERALMTTMLLTLVGTVADEIRVRLPDGPAAASDCSAEEMVEQLRRAGLLRDPALVGLLLRRADESRALAGPVLAPSPLQEWTGDEIPNVAAAAMAVVLARAASRDRFGLPGLELGDCNAETAVALSYAVAAALARRSPELEEGIVAATVDLLGRHDEGQSLHALEAKLVIALHSAGRVNGDLLGRLAASGEVGLLAQALSRLGRIGGESAWDLLLSRRGGGKALLLRIADQPRDVAARVLLLLADRLGQVEPESEIGWFDELSEQEVRDRRSRLRHPPGFSAALDALSHG